MADLSSLSNFVLANYSVAHCVADLAGWIRFVSIFHLGVGLSFFNVLSVSVLRQGCWSGATWLPSYPFAVRYHMWKLRPLSIAAQAYLTIHSRGTLLCPIIKQASGGRPLNSGVRL